MIETTKNKMEKELITERKQLQSHVKPGTIARLSCHAVFEMI